MSATERDVDHVVIGAGVVGLACAAALARRGASVLVLERHARIGLETSSRNSGVIHAGLYYAPGSLKALTCVEGRERLYHRAAREGLPHAKLGKLVVATDAGERAYLETLAERGRANGAGELSLLDARELSALEPRVRAVAALYSPESGIVDVHALAQSYATEATAHGAQLVLRSEVLRIEPSSAGLTLHVRSGDDATTITAGSAVNAAGLEAQVVASRAGLDPAALGCALYPCKGDYFALAPELRGLVRHLVYPVPSAAGLGIHLTLDLGGELRAGPDTEYVEAPRYDVAADKAEMFAAALRRYVPELRAEQLRPDYAGVRPKLQGPGQSVRDFELHDASGQGVPGLLSLFGIESPGLTASEALAERVAQRLAER